MNIIPTPQVLRVCLRFGQKVDTVCFLVPRQQLQKLNSYFTFHPGNKPTLEKFLIYLGKNWGSSHLLVESNLAVDFNPFYFTDERNHLWCRRMDDFGKRSLPRGGSGFGAQLFYCTALDTKIGLFPFIRFDVTKSRLPASICTFWLI